jgi:hypothetical protein
MGEMIQTTKHTKRGSRAKWFILALIPIADLYVFWKLCGILATHEDAILPKDKVE